MTDEYRDPFVGLWCDRRRGGRWLPLGRLNLHGELRALSVVLRFFSGGQRYSGQRFGRRDARGLNVWAQNDSEMPISYQRDADFLSSEEQKR